MVGRFAQVGIALRVRRELGRRVDQQAALAALRSHAQRNSPFYGRLYAGLEDAPLHELPEVGRDLLLEHFDEAVTDSRITHAGLSQFTQSAAPDERFLGRYRVGTTSGTSGRPGIIPFDDDEWVAMIVGAARAQAITRPEGPPPGPRFAKLSAPSPWRLSNQVGATLKDPRKPTLRLPMTLPLPELRRQLEEFQPDRLNASPSILELLAVEQLAGRLAIHPSLVMSSGEVLHATIREIVRDAWGAEVRDEYLCTEACFVAAQCAHGEGMHVIDDQVILEVVDAHGAPVEPGGTGARVLLTVLSSRTLPRIRMALSDAVRVLPEPCPCGRTSARVTVDGRTEELIRFTTPGDDILVHSVLFASVMDTVRAVRWQVRYRDDRIRVLVAGQPGDLDHRAIETGIADALLGAGLGRVMPVEVVPVDDIERSPSGKVSRAVPDDA